MQSRRGFALSYLRVEKRSGPPRGWGWSLHRSSSDILIRRSDAAYGCAEDAWKAGQAAFAVFEAAVPPSYVRVDGAARRRGDRPEPAGVPRSARPRSGRAAPGVGFGGRCDSVHAGMLDRSRAAAGAACRAPLATAARLRLSGNKRRARPPSLFPPAPAPERGGPRSRRSSPLRLPGHRSRAGASSGRCPPLRDRTAATACSPERFRTLDLCPPARAADNDGAPASPHPASQRSRRRSPSRSRVLFNNETY